MARARLRLVAGVLAAVGSGVGLAMAVVLILLGGILDIVHTSGDLSMALSGVILLFLAGFAGVTAAGFLAFPWTRLAAMLLAVDIALIVWALALADAGPWAVIPAIPLSLAVLLGLAAPEWQEPRAHDRRADG